MISTYSLQTVKKLAFKFILDNIDYRKRCSYLQEIISLGKTDDVWRRVLVSFFNSPVNYRSFKAFSKN